MSGATVAAELFFGIWRQDVPAPLSVRCQAISPQVATISDVNYG